MSNYDETNVMISANFGDIIKLKEGTGSYLRLEIESLYDPRNDAHVYLDKDSIICLRDELNKIIEVL